MLLFSISEALTWTQEPEKPTKIVEDGVNNKNVKLVWKYLADAGENIAELTFFREEVDGRHKVSIAQRLYNTAFEPKNNFRRYCRGELPSQLVIFNVDNVKEYKFTLEVAFSKGITFHSAVSSVVVEVFGKYNYYLQIKLSLRFILGSSMDASLLRSRF